MLGAALLGAALTACDRWRYVALSARTLFAYREALLAHLRACRRASSGTLRRRRPGPRGRQRRRDPTFAIDALLFATKRLIALCGLVVLIALLRPALLLIALSACGCRLR